MSISLPSVSGPFWTVARKFIILHWVWLMFYVFVARKGASNNPSDFFSWSWSTASNVGHWLYQAVAS